MNSSICKIYNIVLKAKIILVNLPIKTKISLLILLITFMPILSIGIISYSLSKSVIEEITIQSTIAEQRFIETKLEDYLKAMEEISVIILSDEDLQRFLTTYISISDKINTRDKVRSMFDKYVNINPQIVSIALLDNNNEVAVYVSNNSEYGYVNSIYYLNENSKNSEIYNKISLLEGGILWSKVNEKSREISLMRAVNLLGSREKIGILIISFDVSILDDILQDANFYKSGNLIIRDTLKNILYSKIFKKDSAGGFSSQEPEEALNYFEKVNSRDYLIINNEMRYTGWYLNTYLDKKETFRTSNVIKNLTYFIVIICTIFAGLVIYLLSNYITKPLFELRDLMKKVELGNLNVQFYRKSRDEIGQLSESFNDMVFKMKKLIKDNYEVEIRSRKNELKALQHEINPHFLYNTLDTINWMAQEIGEYDIARVSRSLANYFRLSLSNGKQIINIEEELQQLDNYLQIQKVRYGDFLNYDIKADMKALKYTIVKLTLQPLVENAIYHGLKENDDSGNIVISVSIINDRIEFKVCDDGLGMDEEKLKAVIDSLNIKRTKGFGLSNVYERLKLHFKEDCGFCITSEYGKGTLVKFSIPMIMEEDSNESANI